MFTLGVSPGGNSHLKVTGMFVGKSAIYTPKRHVRPITFTWESPGVVSIPFMWLNVHFESKCKLKVIVSQLTVIVGLALPERLSVQRVEHLSILREQLASGFPVEFSGCIFPRKRQTEDSTRQIRTTLSWPLFGKLTSQHNSRPFLPL